ncbi:S-adenosylmethionine synthetase [Dehalogenimonas sp. WBC-2]|nr:S-adenosylmethionine synthetase [Dehalogenimonas sp. WBC-2]
MVKEYLLSSESVSEGHPDKIADQISDAVLDVMLRQDKQARVACETLVTQSLVVVAGEISTVGNICVESLVRNVLRDIGYNDAYNGISYDCCTVLSALGRQSNEIVAGISLANGALGAGDQGMMFGYATDETPELMPLGISLAHKLMQKQAELRKNETLPWLRPDAKAQVTVKYIDNNPVEVTNVVIATQHEDVPPSMIKERVVEEIIKRVIPSNLITDTTAFQVNTAGRFVVGGPKADTGLTGRKIIVDTYGGMCPHGGGAFSGKDPSKVDRTGAYMARYIAKNIVAAGIARRCTVQLAYSIGVPDPVSFMIDTHGTGKADESGLKELIRWLFRLDVSGMIETLDLQRPIYRQTAAYGHFGRELPDFTWEKTDKAEVLKEYCKTSGGIRR